MPKNYYRKSGNWRKNKRRKSTDFNGALKALRTLKTDSLIKNLITLVALCGVFGFFVLAIMFAVYSRALPDPNQLTNRSVVQSTKIFDNTGENLLYEIHGGEKRTLMKMQEGFCETDTDIELDEEGIPLFALQATIAAEDHKFCTHKGYSITGLMRAVVFRGTRGGGSTLTQQLIKNAILTNEKTITRKIKELILSVELERRYSKDQILQIYFNEIPYGSTNYGIESASRTYFGKTVKDLTLPEAATLAALPKAPTTYLNNPERLKARRDFILSEMKDLGFITKTEYKNLIEEETPISFHVTDIVAPHFVFFVKEQLEEKYGQKVVEQGGLKVTTTIDYEMQLAAEEAVRSGVDEHGERLGFENASLVAINPKNGHIVSMVGSKDYFDEEIDGSVNVSTRLRQPGSSFKPIVYTAAFDRGYTPNTILWDVNTTFKTDVGDYAPLNYGERESGPVTIRQALQGSLNVPAVKTTYLTGLENAFEFAKKFDYTTFGDLSNYGLSIVLGGAEVKLLEHTNAYAILANNGVGYDEVSILKVEESSGEILEEWEEVDGKQLINSELTHITTNVLSDNNARAFVFGTGSYLQLGERPVAAKTGTTNDARDAWLMGYTPSLAVGVWAGNNDNSTMSDQSGGSSAAGPIWNAFMRSALSGQPIESFPAAEIPTTGKGILDGVMPAQTVTIDRLSGKLASEYTPEEYRETITCMDLHSILHYVNPDDPTGGAPNKPEKDSQYESWEAAIQSWVDRTNEENPDEPQIQRCEAPTEVDDIHTKRNQPKVNLTNTNVNNGRAITTSVSVDAKRPVSRVEYWLDGKYITSSAQSPFSVSFEAPPSFGEGRHTLKAIAFDDVGNNGFDEKNIQLETPPRVAAIAIMEPIDNQTIEKTNEVFSVSLQVRNPTRFDTLSLFAQKRNSTSKQLVGSVLNPTSPFPTIVWTLPEEGDWVLTATAHTPDNQIETTTGVVVHIKEGPNTPTETTEEPTFDPFGLIGEEVE